MFFEQRRIYAHLARRLTGKTVMEAGCGVGLGTAMLSRTAAKIVGTDVLARCVDFAGELYPWLEWDTWDISQPSARKAQVVVAVEVVEHVANLQVALANLIAAASETVWITTPNGTGRPRPPANPYHVCEYTPQEVLAAIGDRPTQILNADTWLPVGQGPDSEILVYRIDCR